MPWIADQDVPTFGTGYASTLSYEPEDRPVKKKLPFGFQAPVKQERPRRRRKRRIDNRRNR